MWKGYRNKESNWIKESDLNLAAKRYVRYKLHVSFYSSFQKLSTPPTRMEDYRQHVLTKMAKSLNSGSIQRCKFSTPFRMDVFKYLFEGKGVRSSFGQGMNYEKENFDERFFPSNWDVAYDHL